MKKNEIVVHENTREGGREEREKSQRISLVTHFFLNFIYIHARLATRAYLRSEIVTHQLTPWNVTQAVTKSLDPKERPAIIVPGASHHFWTHPAKPTDSPFVVKARLQIGEFVSKALAEPADSQRWGGGGGAVDQHVGERITKLQMSQAKASQDRLQRSRESPPSSEDERDVGAEGKEKEVKNNFMTNNDRLPGVPLAPFQVIQRYHAKSSSPNL